MFASATSSRVSRDEGFLQKRVRRRRLTRLAGVGHEEVW
jgi:hypothetical protein